MWEIKHRNNRDIAVCPRREVPCRDSICSVGEGGQCCVLPPPGPFLLPAVANARGNDSVRGWFNPLSPKTWFRVYFDSL